MTLNAEKCHLLVSGYKHKLMFASISDEMRWEENIVKLLGTLIALDLTFHNHIRMICKKRLPKTNSYLHIQSYRTPGLPDHSNRPCPSVCL